MRKKKKLTMLLCLWVPEDNEIKTCYVVWIYGLGASEQKGVLGGV